MAVGLGAGVPTLERLSASAERVRWSAATRFIFRIWFVFTLLLIVPRSIEFLFNLGVWPLIVNWVGRWPITHILHRPEHLLAGPMSGADFLPDFLAAAILGGASVVIALAWTLAAPERDHPALFSWLTTVVRFLLGGLLLFYAWDKILPGQFGPGPNLQEVVRPVAQLTPMELLWAFMSASRPYAVFSGIAEGVGATLLLARRTAVLGAIIAVFALANVFMLNVAYDVGVKFLAAQMLVMALSLIVPHITRVLRFFVGVETVPLRARPLFDLTQRDRVARIGGALVALFMVWWTYGMAHQIVAQITTGIGAFHGVWEIESMQRDGSDVPLLVTDGSLWRRIVFPGDDTGAFVTTMAEAETPYGVQVDKNKATVTLTPRPIAAARAKRSIWTFAFGGPEKLELRGVAPDGSTMMRFRRVNVAEWPIIAHEHGWRW